MKKCDNHHNNVTCIFISLYTFIHTMRGQLYRPNNCESDKTISYVYIKFYFNLYSEGNLKYVTLLRALVNDNFIILIF